MRANQNGRGTQMKTKKNGGKLQMRAMTNDKGVRMRAKKNLFFLFLLLYHSSLLPFEPHFHYSLLLFFIPILMRIKVLTKWFCLLCK